MDPSNGARIAGLACPAPPLGQSPVPLSSAGRRRFLFGTLVGALGFCLPSLEALGAASTSEGALQQRVSAHLQAVRAQGLLGRGEGTSWSVYDLTSGEQLVALSQEVPRQAASMIKPFVAQAYFFEAADSRGRLGYNDQVRALMTRSIRDSDNAATNQLMSLVIRHARGKGPRDVERVLKRHAPHIFRETLIVETIPSGGQTYRNKASAADYSRFLRALWGGQLPYAAELKSLMALPNRDRISDGVAAVPDHLTIYDKTGSTARLCGDMGIVEARGRNGRRYPYVFVGIIERGSSASNYGHWIHARGEVLREVSGLVYTHLKQRYDLV